MPTPRSLNPTISTKSATTKIHPHLFIASLGNPSPYANTLHSAGHHLLARLAILLSAPPLAPSTQLARGHSSHTNNPLHPHVHWMLWQSPVQMNVSGRAVKGAWGAWSSGSETEMRMRTREGAGAGTGMQGNRAEIKRLVILHDELEAPLGKVKVRGGFEDSGGGGGGGGGGGSGAGGKANVSAKVASAKGHNGVKSVLDAFPARGRSVVQKQSSKLLGAAVATLYSDGVSVGVEDVNKSNIVRVGVGIGRPESRDPADVSRFVLRRMSERESRSVEGAAEEVLERLKGMTVSVPVGGDG